MVGKMLFSWLFFRHLYAGLYLLVTLYDTVICSTVRAQFDSNGIKCETSCVVDGIDGGSKLSNHGDTAGRYK